VVVHGGCSGRKYVGYVFDIADVMAGFCGFDIVKSLLDSVLGLLTVILG
jgi:hypothetical protein